MQVKILSLSEDSLPKWFGPDTYNEKYDNYNAFIAATEELLGIVLELKPSSEKYDIHIYTFGEYVIKKIINLQDDKTTFEKWSANDKIVDSIMVESGDYSREINEKSPFVSFNVQRLCAIYSKNCVIVFNKTTFYDFGDIHFNVQICLLNIKTKTQLEEELNNFKCCDQALSPLGEWAYRRKQGNKFPSATIEKHNWERNHFSFIVNVNESIFPKIEQRPNWNPTEQMSLTLERSCPNKKEKKRSRISK